MPIQNFKPLVCQCCNTKLTYILPIDKGSTDLLKAISIAIRKKGINEIHLRDEMEVSLDLKGKNAKDRAAMIHQANINGHIVSNQTGNLSRPKRHGLIAPVAGAQDGTYCLTRKGAAYLRGDRIPKYAIIDKVKGKQVGYFEESTETCTVNDFLDPDCPYWEMINFDVVDKKIILIVGNHVQAKLL
ncbi:MAG: hypothetical protein PHO56_02115 [Patescibacteria group bacterium]|nr:hypothetical protein [Patescibacteria group bacterium]